MKRLLIAFLLILVQTTMCQSAVQDSIRRAYAGIIVVQSDSAVRAMEPYNARKDGLDSYIRVVGRYKRMFPNTRVYCMLIPNAIAFYCPEEAQEWTQDEGPVIEYMLGGLPKGVIAVNLMPALSDHIDEPIYARTDHHWMPLGAYYAAEQFAFDAGVPFMPLSCYKPDTIRHFVGTMQKFSHDASVGRYPEDFVYYIPQGIDYETTRHVYTYSTIRKGRGRRRQTQRILTIKQQPETTFFRSFPDGSAAAYSTFMGGDLNQTSVRTATHNGRRLMILKDSYGNALPAFLFGSFEEIHVVDCRYFIGNMVQFVHDHAITDILFANNLIHASSPVTSNTYEQYLTQKGK